MKAQKIYTIELQCGFAERWRYNIELIAASFNEEGEQTGYHPITSRIADSGAELKCPPEGVEIATRLSLETVPCHKVELLVYFIPHTLPADEEIEATAPVQCPLVVRAEGREVCRHSIEVNGWGGASFRTTIEG